MTKVEKSGLSFSEIFISRKSFEHTTTQDIYLMKIKDHGEKLLNKGEAQAQEKEFDQNNQIFLENLNELQEKFLDHKFEHFITSKPVFRSINVDNFAKAIQAAPLESIEILTNIFNGRYRSINYSDEEKTLKQLFDSLNHYLTPPFEKTRKNWHINNLRKIISETINSYTPSVIVD